MPKFWCEAYFIHTASLLATVFYIYQHGIIASSNATAELLQTASFIVTEMGTEQREHSIDKETLFGYVK
jgi:hypothetical protein